jgi:hypothetical protein
MDSLHKPFSQQLSDMYDMPARYIMYGILKPVYPSLIENAPSDWEVPDFMCDKFYHELQVVKSWTIEQTPPNIIIWGRKDKYLCLDKPTIFWALSNDCHACCWINSNDVKKTPTTLINSSVTQSGKEICRIIPFDCWVFISLDREE